MPPTKLTEAALAAGLARLPAWSRQGDALARTVTCPSFLGGIALVQQVAQVAEKADHHPDMLIQWRKVTFTLTTHDAGGLTQLDLDLAAEIDRLAGAAGATG